MSCGEGAQASSSAIFPSRTGNAGRIGNARSNPYSRALAFALALFLIINLAFAETDFNAYRDKFGDIFNNKLGNWQVYAGLALAICFLFNLLLFMAAKALQSEHLKKYALSEFMQVTASALLIAFAVQLLFTLSTGSGMDFMGEVIGKESVVFCGAPGVQNGVFQLWTDYPDYGSGPLGAFRCKLQEKIIALDDAYSHVYTNNMDTERFSSTCMIMFGIPVYCGDWDLAIHKKMEESHLMATKIVSLLVPLHALYALATYIENNMLAVFLPVGLVLRIFPLTRGVGGLFIAIAIGLFFVWPTFFVLTDSTFVKADAAADPNAARSEGTCFTGFKGTSVMVQNLLSQTTNTWSNDSLAIDNAAQLVFQLTISIMFYPFIALVIALVFIRAMTPLLGGDMGEFMKMVGRLG